MKAPADIEKLERYFLERMPRVLNYSAGLDILLVVIEEKPGALVMGVSTEQENVVRELCREFGLAHLYSRDIGAWERMKRKLGFGSTFDNPSIAVTRESGRLDILEKSEANGFTYFTQETLGRFLGYPEEAVEFYSVSDDAPGMVVQEKVEQLVGEGELDKADLKYLELVDYVPPPELKSIEAAIERGRDREEVLLELDRETETSVGELYLEELMGRSLSG